MTKRPSDFAGPASGSGEVDPSMLSGVDKAIGYCRVGRLISAIKLIEAANPGITREEAKAFVHSLGYGRELRWPEDEKLSPRCL